VEQKIQICRKSKIFFNYKNEELKYAEKY